jgi:predicted nucleic acid-binding protein
LIYLDANTFIYASLNQKALGEKSRSILSEVQEGKISAASSALSFDEIIWAVKKQRGESDGIAAGQAMINMSGLNLLDVNSVVLSSAIALIKKYHLNPRDSIHAASAIDARAEFIVSEDPDFDGLAEIKRKPILDV